MLATLKDAVIRTLKKVTNEVKKMPAILESTAIRALIVVGVVSACVAAGLWRWRASHHTPRLLILLWLQWLFEKMWGWLKQKTKAPGDLATSSFAWTVVILGSLYLLSFGFAFSLNGWKNMLTTHRGLVPFISMTLFIGTLFIIAIARSNILAANEKWRFRLGILMPTILVLSLIAHFLFFAFDARPSTQTVPAIPASSTIQQSQPQPPAFPSAPVPPPSTPTTAPSIPVPTTANVAMRGVEASGKKLFDLPADRKAKITYTGGEVCVKSEAKTNACLGPHGWKDQNLREYRYPTGGDPVWRESYRYPHVPDVSAGETLIILGEIGSAKEQVFQFPNTESQITIHNTSEKTLSLYLYPHLMLSYCSDSSAFIFPNEKVAKQFGHEKVTCGKSGYDANPTASGAMEFHAEILD